MKEYEENNWWYADGSQPISNGGLGLVVDRDKDNPKQIRVVYLISCCSNDGDYNIIEIDKLLDKMWKATLDKDCKGCGDNPEKLNCLDCNPAKKYFTDNLDNLITGGE